MWDALFDEMRIECFEVCEADKLGSVGKVTDVSTVVGMETAPFFCCHAKLMPCSVHLLLLHRLLQFYLWGVLQERGVRRCTGMDAVVDFCEVPPDVPAELFLFFVF